MAIGIGNKKKNLGKLLEEYERATPERRKELKRTNNLFEKLLIDFYESNERIKAKERASRIKNQVELTILPRRVW